MKRLPALLLALALLAAACSTSKDTGAVSSSSTSPSASTITEPAGEQTAEPETAAPTTAWEQVLAGVADPLPLQTAVDAFSVAFRPIDGATPTDLEAGFAGSGSGALRWVLGHWEELTPTQQAQVEAVLAAWEGPDGAGGGAGAPGGSMVPSAANRAAFAADAPQALVDDMVVNLETLLGRSLSMPVYAKAAASGAEVDNALAMTVTRDAAGGFGGPPASCKIYFAPDALALTGAEAVSLAAHEVFHCFEYDLGTILQAAKRPAWIIEGMSEWVGESVSGGSALSQWTWAGWLDTAAYRPLFARAYDAIGFYAHLNDSGIEVWSRLDPAILASDVDSATAYEVLIDGAPPELIDSWAAGYFRDPAHAPLWDQNGPGITLDAPDIEEFPLSNESSVALAAGPYAAFFMEVQATAEVVTFESPGAGLALLADGTSVRLADLHGEALCTTGSCACPAGTPGEGTVFTPTVPGLIDVAATGHTSGSTVTVVGWTLDRYCHQERCQVGTWRSGEWHVPRVIAGGRDAALWITRDGEGYVDWSEAGDLYGVVQGGTVSGNELLPLRLDIGGSGHFFGETVGTVFQVTAAAGSMSITPYIDLGEGWIQTGPGTGFLGYGTVNSDATFACAGNTLVLNGAVEFWRVSTDAVLPPEAADLTPTTGAGAGSTTVPAALPEVDPCSLLALEEVQAFVPGATAPAGPDDLPTTYFTQCSFSPAVAIQVYGPASPALFTEGTEMLGVTVQQVQGIGDWALAQITEPDPQLNTGEAVLLVAAGSAKGTVALVPFVQVLPDSPEYQALLGLLELALSRL